MTGRDPGRSADDELRNVRYQLQVYEAIVVATTALIITSDAHIDFIDPPVVARSHKTAGRARICDAKAIGFREVSQPYHGLRTAGPLPLHQ